ncbi:MAG: hypothetical protein M3449_08215 [Acidobacteriota bacterium]|nr:hypothetical protein [Acidobacteriota bacterium]
MFNIFKKKDPIEKFWRWFVDNKAKFETDPNKEPVPDLDPILVRLRMVSNGLSVEVSRELNGVRDLVISANGDKSKFLFVQKIVDRAPVIDGWTVTQFRQRANIAFVLETESIRLATDEMYFEPLLEENEVDLIVYAKDVKDLDNDVLNHFGLIVIDNVLGEYDSVMKVRHFDFQDLTNTREKQNLKPLSELPKYIDAFYSRTNN